MTSQSVRERLIIAANAFTDELRNENLQSVFRTKIQLPTPEQTKTGGWCLPVATWVGHPRIELWLDKWLGEKVHHFWFGFWSTEEDDIVSLISQMPETLIPRGKPYSYEHFRTFRGINVLKRSPSASDISHPIFERFPTDGIFCFGMYDNGSHGSANRLQLDAARAASFIGSVVRAVADFEEDYPSIKEGRRIVARHVRLERDSRAALRCKRRDSFRCQVCTLRFEDWYGEIGRTFAEAHHKVPLSELKHPRALKVGDLITVCANCHRMLHKMDGEAGDADRLRAILKMNNHPLLSGSKHEGGGLAMPK
jgi:predicted HNH restriction endonuclease